MLFAGARLDVPARALILRAQEHDRHQCLAIRCRPSCIDIIKAERRRHDHLVSVDNATLLQLVCDAEAMPSQQPKDAVEPPVHVVNLDYDLAYPRPIGGTDPTQHVQLIALDVDLQEVHLRYIPRRKTAGECDRSHGDDLRLGLVRSHWLAPILRGRRPNRKRVGPSMRSQLCPLAPSLSRIAR